MAKYLQRQDELLRGAIGVLALFRAKLPYLSSEDSTRVSWLACSEAVRAALEALALTFDSQLDGEGGDNG